MSARFDNSESFVQENHEKEPPKSLVQWLEAWAETIGSFGTPRCQWLARQVREIADNARLFSAESPHQYDERLELLTRLTEQAVRDSRESSSRSQATLLR